MKGLQRQLRLGSGLRLLFCFCLVLAKFAHGKSSIHFDWNGNYKSIFGYQKLRQRGLFPQDSQWLSEQRLRFNSTLTWDSLRLEFANEASLFFQGANDPVVSIDSGKLPYWNTQSFVVDSSSVDLVHRIDRINLQLRVQNTEWVLGKQVVSLGSGKLFSAISQSPQQPFIRVDPEYAITEDALTWRWEGLLSLEVRFLPRPPSQRTHNFHARVKTSKDGTDLAFVSGRSDDKSFLGFEAAGSLDHSLVRGEVVYYRTDLASASGQQDYFQLLAGFDHTFSPRWSMKAEMFYNGFGNPEGSFDLSVSHRNTNLFGRYYLGSGIQYEMTERLKASLNWISNLADPSFLTHWNIGYSVSQNSEISIGYYWNFGFSDRAEFGGQKRVFPSSLASPSLGYSDFAYLLWKWYF